ncbi:hypothetical protein GOP47_0023260 [Adiantum capillus-veneris]|uniref:Uncharacterized protein n=1 Tax=Adiantum capillus-veneris TaxID=13818 RepID=A0A9D4U716_ADICA|nr:hypothetical protein GOP47_0023260 [Adiantum capillus-veneris]
MPQTSSASDVLGIGTLVLVVICCCVGACCLAYVLFFHFRVGKERQPLLRDFDSPWVVRLVLICLSMLWTLGELFRLPWLREKDRMLHNMGIGSQENLCRFHVVWSVGLMEPGLLLTVLFLVQGSLQEAPRHLNGRVLLLMCLSCLPVFVLQLSLAAAGHGSSSKGFGSALPSYFTRSYKVIQEGSNSQLALCNYPLFSILALGIFSMVFVFCFARLGYRMLCHVINRKLRMRVYWLLTTVLLFLPLHVILLGVTVKLDPNRTVHEILMFLGFLTLLLCVAAAMGVLVILPVADAIAVHYFFRSRDQSWQNFSASAVEAFGGSPPPTGVSDNEDSPNNAARSLLLGAPSASGTDVGSSSRDGSLTFDVGKDLTLGPGGWLVDVPGFVASPPSPVLPGRPLTLL